MKKVGIRNVQINLTSLLKDLPFAITRYGKVIAIVKDEKVIDYDGEIIKKPVFKKLTKPTWKKPKKKYVNKEIGFCEHGSRKDLCVHTKCRK